MEAEGLGILSHCNDFALFLYPVGYIFLEYRSIAFLKFVDSISHIGFIGLLAFNIVIRARYLL